jgi:hypothetical protein
MFFDWVRKKLSHGSLHFSAFWIDFWLMSGIGGQDDSGMQNHLAKYDQVAWQVEFARAYRITAVRTIWGSSISSSCMEAIDRISSIRIHSARMSHSVKADSVKADPLLDQTGSRAFRRIETPSNRNPGRSNRHLG